MVITIQSNPIYYSLSSCSSNPSSSAREVVLHRRVDRDAFGVYIGEDVPSGLYVVTVESGSPAAVANIQPGDRVLAIDGQLVSTMKSPKDMLIQIASNSPTLRLTIQSTNMLDELDVPLRNTHRDKKNDSGSKRSSVQTTDMNADLEGYIRTLFANEDIQIIPSLNKNEFIIQNNSTPKSSMQPNVLSSRSSHSESHKRQQQQQQQHHHHHQHQRHHHQHREARPKILVTKETQTSIDEDEDENIQEPPPVSPNRPYPSMGTSHRLLRTQQVAQIAPAASKQYMADVVRAAVVAQRRREAQNREPAVVPQRVPTPPPHVDPVVIIPAPTPGELPVLPPPYSVRDALAPDDSNRESVNEGSYNVRDAQENRQVQVSEHDAGNIPPSITGRGVHVVHLHSSPNFEGFGFYLQYNKSYFLINKIEESSPAELSGLRANDVILAINQSLTDKMPHSEFVTIVGANSTIDFVVQPIEDYLRSNFRPSQNKLLAPTTSTKDSSDAGQQKFSLSKTINRLTGR
ncbi:unnamed protein product [Rotaria socialis]|uniref:PDZ domain-containing protein n=1 Tax=Rotaria socialis TaxID=392032 RepID=A0A818BT84_9BILA|nr:unnamed protein product [Rotaria socialis]CAF4574498.1 unnamed protein product [Rotaria socialis]